MYPIRRPFFEKRISQELEAGFLGDEWKVRKRAALQERLCERLRVSRATCFGSPVGMTSRDSP